MAAEIVHGKDLVEYIGVKLAELSLRELDRTNDGYQLGYIHGQQQILTDLKANFTRQTEANKND